MTLQQALDWCSASEECHGFCYGSPEAHFTGQQRVYMKVGTVNEGRNSE